MKVNLITNPIHGITFKGTREDRNTVSQLAQNNTYSLTEPNQRRINKAIDNLAQQRGEENIQFLLNVGKEIKYDTNFTTGVPVKNAWKEKLKGAAETSLSISSPDLKEKYQPEIDSVFGQRPLTQDEKDIQKSKIALIETVGDDKHAEKIKKDLNYFVSSTETSIAQKKYILERLNYFMSPEYKINPQLTDKKPQILSEMINDISVNTLDSDIPNIKAINQKLHGMCAAISITRKAIAYEDKANYVDSLISELDDSDKVMVYDIQHLGSGKRIPVNKVFIDFDRAQELGYRIVDASTLQWMNIANMYGAQNESLYDYTPFDKGNFDAFQDSFFTKNFEDPSLISKQSYYQSLAKAKDTLKELKTSKIKSEVQETEQRRDYDSNLEMIGTLTDELRSSIREILPDESKESVQRISKDLISLQKPYSSDIDKNREDLREVSFIPNEESSQKKIKVEKYFNRYSENSSMNEDALNKNSEKIVDLISSIHDLDKDLNPKHTIRSDFRKGRELYEAEAVYRTAKMFSFTDEDRAAELMTEYNIPDRETRMINGFDRVIDGIKKDDKTITQHFSRILGIPEENKDELIENLEATKQGVEYLSTDVHDYFYNAMGLGSRAEFLTECINNNMAEINEGNTEELKDSAKRLHVKNDKKAVRQEYNRLLERLANPEDKEAVTDAFNKLGVKDQSSLIIDLYKSFCKNFSPANPDRDMHINIFKQNNGLDINMPEEEVFDHINNIADEINAMCASLQNAEQILDIPKENGEPYFTTKGYKLLIKRAESDGDIVSDSAMEKLQERFTKVDKLRSSDEFNSRQGKISQPELYKFSHEEKAALKQIDKKLNKMYSEVTRELNKQYRDIKEPLEKNAMYIGTNSGRYWTGNEGSSGLYASQEMKIFEQITDRPYYSGKDILTAAEKIKNGTYSGVTGSSVFHNRVGGHGQYVADIKPIKGKDALMHDNSWGASEHENIWTDSEGLTRTDYSDNRGGDIGYITDDVWRNGNYVRNLNRKKGHISPDETNSRLYQKLKPDAKAEYDFSLMYDVLLCGENPEHRDIAASLRDTIFVPDSAYLPTIQKQANSMTKKELQKSMFRAQSAGVAYHDKYERVMERINGKDFLSKGINSQEEYDALDESDITKVALEKTALRYSYDDSDIIKDLPKARTLKDLDKLREKQRKEAYENFEYAFGKTTEALLYPGTKHSEKMIGALTKALKDYNIQYTEDNLIDMAHNISAFEKGEKDKCTGSVKDTIDFAVEKAGNQFSKVIPESEASNKAKEQYLSDLRKVFEDNMYFNEEDLKSNSEKAKGIQHWIDRKFNPQSDEEFVQIYRNLQDMTKEEFSEVAKDVTNEELGINPQTGYDILVKIKASQSTPKAQLRNTLFYDEYSKDVSRSKTKPAYKYDKTERNLRGAYYDGTRTFDDLYRTMYFACSGLEIEKAYNKYKDSAFREYGAFPSYPKVNNITDKNIDSTYNSIESLFGNTISEMNTAKNCIFDIKIVHLLDRYRAQIPEGRPLTKTENKVMSGLLTEFVKYNADDQSMEHIVENAHNALELKDDATIAEYNQFLDPISSQIRTLESINSEEVLENNIKVNNMYLDSYMTQLVRNEIAPRYRKTLIEDINNVKTLMRKTISVNGLDDNRDTISIIQKLDESSENEAEFKQKLDKFATLSSHISKTKLLKNSENPNEEQYNAQLNKTNKYADSFTEQCFGDDDKKNVRANIRDYINRELSSDNQRPLDDDINYAIRKLKKDFKRGHFVSNPTMLLDTYLTESASDVVRPKESKYLERLGTLLKNQLEFSQLVEVQGILMEAVETGNPAQVREHFEDFNIISPITGKQLNMNSDEAIDLMVKSILIVDSTKTAKMLIEKLGLGDRFMKIEHETIDKSAVKEKIDELGGILHNHNVLSDIVTEEMMNLADRIDDADKPSSEIYKAKRTISKRAKSLYTQADNGELSDSDKMRNKELKRDIKFYFNTLSAIDKYFNEHPELLRSDVVKQTMSEAISAQADTVNERIQEPQEYIKTLFSLYKFLEDVHLPEYSEGAKIQKELSKDFTDIANYNEQVLKKSSGRHSRFQYREIGD